MTPTEIRIATLDNQIEISKMRAHWWIASATTGECKSRRLFHGASSGPEFTDAEKVADALDTAARFIDLMRQAMEDKEKLLAA